MLALRYHDLYIKNMNSFGCLFCTFRVGGDIRKAHCEFRDVSGVVWDHFEIESLPELQKKIEYTKKNNGKEEVSLTTPIKKHDLFAFVCGAAFSWYRLYLRKLQSTEWDNRSFRARERSHKILPYSVQSVPFFGTKSGSRSTYP